MSGLVQSGFLNNGTNTVYLSDSTTAMNDTSTNTNSILLGVGCVQDPTIGSQLVVGSSTAPIATATTSSGASGNWLYIVVNSITYKINLENV